MELNCFGALHLIQLALPHLRATRGCVVNISTLGTRVSNPAAGGYNMSKAALDQATRQLADELGASGVRVNGALMGWMDGEPLRKNFDSRATLMTGALIHVNGGQFMQA
jgi:NAD(P)-dependent dehydrogenase (short-subunit alcohol dehydrogenase family)